MDTHELIGELSKIQNELIERSEFLQFGKYQHTLHVPPSPERAAVLIHQLMERIMEAGPDLGASKR